MKEVTIVFFCTWKFAVAFPVAIYAMNMSVAETFTYTNIGGFIGILFFAYAWKLVIGWWYRLFPRAPRKRNKKLFTRKNRLIVKIKNRLGMPGIVFLTPVLLSIPVGAFLMAKYYGKRSTNLLWLAAGQVLWSVIFIYFYTQIKIVV